MNDAPRETKRATELLRRWQAEDDRDALDELLREEVAAVAARLRARGRGMLRPSVSASDLAQEAVFRLLRLEEAPEFADAGALRAYLWTAAWRLLVNKAQGRARDPVRIDAQQSQEFALAMPGAGGLSQAERADQAQAMAVVLNLLREEDREVLESIYFRQEAIEAYAQRHAIARAAADMRLSRARRRLAEKLADWSDLVT